MNLVLLILSLHLVCVSAMNQQKQQKEEKKIEIKQEYQQNNQIQTNEQKQQQMQNRRAQRIQHSMKDYHSIKFIDIYCGDGDVKKDQQVHENDNVDKIFTDNCKNGKQNKEEEVKGNPNAKYTSVTVETQEWGKFQGLKSEYQNTTFEYFSQRFTEVSEASKLAVGRITYVFDDQELQTIQIACGNENLKEESLAKPWTLEEIKQEFCDEKEYTRVYIKYQNVNNLLKGKMNNLKGDEVKFPYVAEWSLNEAMVVDVKKNQKETITLLAFSNGNLDPVQKDELLKKLLEKQNQRRVRRN